jgi:hypothetical protein
MNISDIFLVPTNPTHRQYEALRAYFVENMPQKDAAKKFGYSLGSFRVMCHQLRKNPNRPFFIAPQRGPHRAPRRDPLREKVVALRKQNLSVYDIADNLQSDGHKLSVPSISLILKEEGFARLPRRRDDERPSVQGRPQIAPVADIRKLDLEARSFHTKFGGLFLFLPFLVEISFDRLFDAGFPGSTMIPAPHAMRSLLALKLFGNARHSHVMSDVFDQGLGLFAGLNAIPKRAFLTEYSCRIDPRSYPRLLFSWFDAVETLGMPHGNSFDLDFHTIPFHGEDALVEKHYVSKRSRRQKGLLAFVVNDADHRAFCYVNADIQKTTMNDQILRFSDFWKTKTGKFPEELIFDSKLTTYANLDKLNKNGIHFITLRRRSKKMLDEIYQIPVSAWRRVQLKNIRRAYRTPRILEQKISLNHYTGMIRQIIIRDLGHEEPTFLLTNQMKRSAPTLIGRYAQRMIIENSISDTIDFFHMDALSSAVAMKVNCDLALTLMASSLYRIFGQKIGGLYKTAESRHIFRDFIAANATVFLTEREIILRFQKRAHNPLLITAGFTDTNISIPWIGGRKLQFQFG